MVGCSIKLSNVKCASLGVLGQKRIHQGKAVRHAPHEQVCSLLQPNSSLLKQCFWLGSNPNLCFRNLALQEVIARKAASQGRHSIPCSTNQH